MQTYESISKLEETIEPHVEWERFSKRIKKGERIITIGGTDSGKTSFCYFISKKFKNIAFFDLDPGQQTLFLPSCISAKNNSKFLKFFIGKLSPRGAETMVLVGLKTFIQEILYPSKPYLAILDTSGYISDDRALILKFSKCLIFNPTKVVILRKENEQNKELQKIKNLLSKYFQTVELPSHNKSKTIPKEKREEIRNQKIKLYFLDAEEIEINKERELVINLGYFRSEKDKDDGAEVIGFFKGRNTTFLGLINQENENMMKVLVPKYHKNWDFIIRSGLKFKI